MSKDNVVDHPNKNESMLEHIKSRRAERDKRFMQHPDMVLQLKEIYEWDESRMALPWQIKSRLVNLLTDLGVISKKPG